MSEGETKSEARRALLTAILGGAGITALSGCLNKSASAKERLGSSSAAVHDDDEDGGEVAWADTVLGPSGLGSSRLGELATSDADELEAELVIARGSLVAGDGGGGAFYWDALGGVDDGGTFIVPDSSGAGATGRSGAGWRRLWEGPLNVRWFGAIPSAIVAGDAQPAIQRALNAARAGAGSVYFPSGEYVVSSSVILPRGTDQPLSLFGDGSHSTIIKGHQSLGIDDAVCTFDDSSSDTSGLAIERMAFVRATPGYCFLHECADPSAIPQTNRLIGCRLRELFILAEPSSDDGLPLSFDPRPPLCIEGARGATLENITVGGGAVALLLDRAFHTSVVEFRAPHLPHFSNGAIAVRDGSDISFTKVHIERCGLPNGGSGPGLVILATDPEAQPVKNISIDGIYFEPGPTSPKIDVGQGTKNVLIANAIVTEPGDANQIGIVLGDDVHNVRIIGGELHDHSAYPSARAMVVSATASDVVCDGVLLGTGDNDANVFVAAGALRVILSFITQDDSGAYQRFRRVEGEVAPNEILHTLDFVDGLGDPYTSITIPSERSFVLRQEPAAAPKNGLHFQAANATSSGHHGANIRFTPGCGFVPGIDSPGCVIFDLGQGAAAHGQQAGAIVLMDHLGIAVDSGFIGDAQGAYYYRFMTAPAGLDGRTHGVGYRVISGGDLVLNAALSPHGAVVVELPETSTFGLGVVFGNTTMFQVVDGQVKVGATNEDVLTISGALMMTELSEGDVPAPPPGKVAVFLSSETHELAYKRST